MSQFSCAASTYVQHGAVLRLDVQQDLFGGWWLVRERGSYRSPVACSRLPLQPGCRCGGTRQAVAAKIKRGYRGNRQHE